MRPLPDNAGEFDRLYTFWGSIVQRLGHRRSLVFDSGDAFERITAARYPSSFNASNNSNTFDDRSNSKDLNPKLWLSARSTAAPARSSAWSELAAS